MSFRRITAYVAAFVSLSGTVVAEEVATVQSLIKQGFAIVGTIAIPAGGGGDTPAEEGPGLLLLRRGDAELAGRDDPLLQAG